MKISELNNDQASELMIRLSQPLANIMDDPEVEPLFKEISESGKMSVAKLVGKLLPKVVAFAIRVHKDDLYEIIGALSGKPSKAVGKMNLLETMKVLKESIDKDFLDFFNLSSPAEENAGE